MSELILTFGPLLAFMLTPVLIPLLAVAVAGVGDLVLPRQRHTTGRRRATANGARGTA